MSLPSEGPATDIEVSVEFALSVGSSSDPGAPEELSSSKLGDNGEEALRKET